MEKYSKTIPQICRTNMFSFKGDVLEGGVLQRNYLLGGGHLRTETDLQSVTKVVPLGKNVALNVFLFQTC